MKRKNETTLRARRIFMTLHKKQLLNREERVNPCKQLTGRDHVECPPIRSRYDVRRQDHTSDTLFQVDFVAKIVVIQLLQANDMLWILTINFG